MKTEILAPSKENIARVAACIAEGGVAAFPTETVYGLGADIFSPAAVEAIYRVKGRPSDNPLIVHVASAAQIDMAACAVPSAAKKLMDAFMPGPLTLILPKRKEVPDGVTAGLDTVGVRMPDHPVCREFLAACPHPVCAPSANTSGSPSPTTAMHVYADLNGKIPYILDGGACRVGVESTIVDACGEVPRILRAGGITPEDVERVTGKTPEIVSGGKVALCPGMKYKHYSPKAEVYFSAYYEGMAGGICRCYDLLAGQGRRPVILCLDESAPRYGGRNVFALGKDYAAYAHNLFASLRRADDEGYDAVVAEGVPSEGIGVAIINRLVKSSGGKII